MPATGTIRTMRTRAGYRYPSSHGSIIRFDFICQRTRFPTGTALGPANFLYSDGDLLFAHGHRRKHADTGRVEAPGLVFLQKHCQNGQRGIVANGISIQGDDQLVTLFASVPLTNERWEPLAEGELVTVARGQLAARQLANESPLFYEQPIDQSALS